MKTRSQFPRLAALLFAALAAAAMVPSRASAAQAKPPAATEDPAYTEFKAKLKNLIELKQPEEIAKLVRAEQERAIWRVEELCQAMLVMNSEEIEREINVLSRAWKEDFRTGFVDHVYAYYSDLMLDAQARAERQKVFANFNPAIEKLTANIGAGRDGAKFDQSAEEFRSLAVQFDRVGDSYHSGRCWEARAICLDEAQRGKMADLRQACDAYGLAIAAWDRVELNNSRYQNAKVRWTFLKDSGFGAAEKPAEPAGPAAAPVAAAPATTVAMGFQPLATLDEIERPNFHADEVYEIWPSLYMQKKGSSVTIPSLEKSPKLVRLGSSQLGIDADGDGKSEKELTLTGNFVKVDVGLGDPAAPRPWAFFVKTGIQDDNYQGLKINLQPDETQVAIYYLNAASVTGLVAATSVRVIDDNMDGVYGSKPLQWGYTGLGSGVTQPDLDSIVIGDSKRARPWSEFQEIGGQWYKLESTAGGTSLKAAPATIETGTVRLDYKGEWPTWLILKGEGTYENCYFDVASPDKTAVSVPAGSWSLFYGELRKGKKQQVAKALILPSPATPSWTVSAGKETVLKLGAPYTFDFRAETSATEVKVLGKSVMVLGSANERYERNWNCVPRPEASLRKTGTKKGGKPERMPLVLDLDEMKEDGTRLYTQDDAWHPLDLALELKKEGETFELQLSEKKNKLFGEIESPWK